MRNTLLLLLLTALVTSRPAAAQTFRASLLGGVNLSQIDGDSLNGFHHFGLNAGLRVVAVLGERWRVGPEILFSQLGARRPRRNANFSSFGRIDVNTVEVPLMVYYKDWRITAEGGLSYHRITNSSVADLRGNDISAERPLREQFLAIKFGATVYFTPNLGLNVRWSKGLGDFDDFPSHDFVSRNISVRAVYTFGDGEALPRAEE